MWWEKAKGMVLGLSHTDNRDTPLEKFRQNLEISETGIKKFIRSQVLRVKWTMFTLNNELRYMEKRAYIPLNISYNVSIIIVTLFLIFICP